MASVFCTGHAVQDFVFQVESLPDRAEKYRATGFGTVGGGPAATAAVAIAKLGGTAWLAARLGDDQAGRILLDELEGWGVRTEWVRSFTGVGTSVSSVLVDPAGERRIVNFLDPALPAEPDWLPEALPQGVDAVLVDVRWPAGALHMLRLARAAGIPGVLDADLPMQAAEELAAAASHVAFSAPGLRDFTGCSEPAAGLEAAHARCGGWCSVTLGAQGALIRDDHGQSRVSGFAVEAVDTLGAGDVWHGAFALALAEGRSEADAACAANAAAAIGVGRRGARRGAPDRAELERFLAQRTSDSGKEIAT